MQERRKYVRLNIPLEVNYTIEGKDQTRYQSITKNISVGGTRLSVETELPKGTVLNLDIKIPTQATPITAKARIAWSKREKEQGSNIYDAGLEFVSISEEDKSVFFQYLCNLMYDQLKKL